MVSLFRHDLLLVMTFHLPSQHGRSFTISYMSFVLRPLHFFLRHPLRLMVGL